MEDHIGVQRLVMGEIIRAITAIQFLNGQQVFHFNDEFLFCLTSNE